MSQAMPTLFGVRPKDVIIFTRLLATLLERGTDLITALSLLKDQVANNAFREVVAAIIQDLNQGSSFSDAIAKHPMAFPTIYRQMIKVSEQTGNHEVVLRQIADYLERDRKAMTKVKKALTYPAFVLVAAIGVMGIMMTVVLPSLMDVFEQFDAKLPITTRLLISSSEFFSQYKLILFAMVIALTVSVLLYLRTSRGKRHLDTLLLKLPVLGRITLLRDITNFTRTLAMMLKAGIPMTGAMSTAVQTVNNRIVRDALHDVRREMLKGQGLSRPMASNKLFPNLLVQFTRVGEEAGTLADDMGIITELYTQEMDDRVSGFVSLLEPAMFLVLGAVVAFIAISVIMPIYTVMGAVG
jgi:type IV pilus assembly protein PilC